jgi:hypothetical protein
VTVHRHTVVPGDNLHAIARQYGADPDDIVRYVPIEDRNLIKPGWTLLVSVEAAEPPAEEPPAEEPPAEEPPAEEPPAEHKTLVETLGVFAMLNNKGPDGKPYTDDDTTHAMKFGFYADALGAVPYSCFLSLHKQGPGIAEANVDDAIKYWKAWKGPRPRMFDVLVPLGYVTGQDLDGVANGDLDYHYERVFTKLDTLAKIVTTDGEPALIVAREGNESELDHAPWGKFKFPEDVYGTAFNRVAAIGKRIIPTMLVNYTTNGPMFTTVAAWRQYRKDKAPFADPGDQRFVIEWGLEYIDLDVLGADGYVNTDGNPAAARVKHMKMLNDLAADLSTRRGKYIRCAWPEWGIWHDQHDAASGRRDLQIMIDGFASQFDPGRLMWHSYFHDDWRFRLELATNWGGVDLLPEYAAMVKAAG